MYLLVYILLSATVSHRDYYELLFPNSEYVDLANRTTPLKLCYNITILRCGNTTLKFLSLLRVDQVTAKFSLISYPSRTEIFIEECGAYMI